ncbi:peptidase M75,Imelysin [Sporocytophaga myxococcoides]|uniref:Peptidase M75,Imelysin n=1 Tax=Sporocytophaga myxococcoides TaxID=153721 RepID=A0A098LGA7_9BACT|nr:imelysin family protein [Sporocytophaga myxococcoides]GAL85494.1 peptidase M75,Imelysin [Sporocytophaga myxococcoides]
MKNTNLLTAKILILSVLIFFSCSKDKDNTDNNVDGFDRSTMLTFIADDIILPSYAGFKIKLDEMTEKSKDFTTNPTSANLIAFRQAWVDAYTEWQKVELFDVGPAERHTLRNFFNIYPTTINTTTTINGTNNGITENIASGNANLNLPANYTAQGFPALDYLLNGIGEGDDAILTEYTTAADANAKLAYVNKIVDQMNSKFNQTYNEWNAGYREHFVSKTSLDIYSSTSLLINGFVFNYERYIRSGKIGIPSGAMSSNPTAYPSDVEAFYKKDLSRTLAITAHQASVDFFNGKSVKTGEEGNSIKTYLNAIEAKDLKSGKPLTDTLNGQFIAIATAMNGLNPDLETEVRTNNQAMIAVYSKLQTATRMLKVDMTSAMSITITYTDNDGD